MTEHQLPDPVAREDAYLAAILDELQGMRNDMAKYGIPPRVQPGVEVTNTVELREPDSVAKAIEAGAQALSEGLAEEATPEPEKLPEPKRKRRKR